MEGNWAQLGWTLAKTLGTVIGSLLMSVLTGKTFKTLLMYPFRKLADRSSSTLEKKLEQQAEADLGVNLGDIDAKK